MLTKPILIGHRGFCGSYPENTLISFEKAIEMGVSAVEFDVHLTKDGVPVISHDGKLGRCCDHTGLINDLTFDEIRTFDFGKWKGEQFAGTQIPTLQEVLDFILSRKPDIFIACEVKDPNPKCAEICYEELKKRNKLQSCSFISFIIEQLHHLHEIDPNTFLHGFRECDMANFIPGSYKIMKRIGIHISKVVKEEVKAFNDMGIEIDSWGIDDEATLEKAIECGVVTLTSNKLDVTVPLMKKKGLM